VKVDRSLTMPLDEPEPPPMRCTWKGQPAVCAADGLAWIERWRLKLKKANADRATTATTAGGFP